MSEDDEVGYGKPPKHTRFKKGRSGNPKGRPKGSKNARTIVNEIMNRTVTIKENGRTRRVKFLEAFVHRLAVKALNGSTRDQIALVKLIHDYTPELLKEAELPRLITVRYVLPDGKTMDSYPDDSPSVDGPDTESKIASVEEQPDPRGDEDDSWLD